MSSKIHPEIGRQNSIAALASKKPAITNLTFGVALVLAGRPIYWYYRWGGGQSSWAISNREWTPMDANSDRILAFTCGYLWLGFGPIRSHPSLARLKLRLTPFRFRIRGHWCPFAVQFPLASETHRAKNCWRRFCALVSCL